MLRSTIKLLMLCCAFFVSANAQSQTAGFEKPSWVEGCKATSFPKSQTMFNATDYGAKNDGTTLNTNAIQATIDACEKAGGGIVTFPAGNYLTGSIFVKKGVQLKLDKGVQLLGSANLADYPEINTRVAGIEMKWPAALVNVNDQDNVAITGEGIINGQGEPFWNSYWTMRKDYEKKKLRWIVDYDCKRPRLLVVANSSNVTINGITLKKSGFWTVQILYSTLVTVSGITIRNNEGGHGPSTDGVDIDSSNKILVENSDIDCNDDNFCLKAGRDADGLRVNRPCEYVVIRNCIAGAGGGLITCGSETSGSIRNIWVEKLTAKGTKVGIRVKSAITRGGVVENVYINDIEMTDVLVPIEVTTNWNPAYSYSTLPQGYTYDNIPDHWKVMLQKNEPESKGIPIFRKIYVSNVSATGAQTGISAAGIKESIVDDFEFANIDITTQKAGTIEYCRNWIFKNVNIKTPNSEKIIQNNCENMQLGN